MTATHSRLVPAVSSDRARRKAIIPVVKDAWTLYPIIREGVPSMMMVDADLSDQVPISGLNVAVVASLEIGVGDRTEVINGLEDDLAERIAGAGGRFVGHVRSSTELLALGYLPELPEGDEAWHRGWTDLHFLEDPEWEMFGVCLSVGPQEEQALHDLEVFMALAEQGDSARKARPVDHQASFADPTSARSFVESVASHGFNLTDWRLEPDSVEVQVTRRDPVLPPPAGISEVVWLVRQRAEAHQGTYIGWGAHVVAPSKKWWKRSRRRESGSLDG